MAAGWSRPDSPRKESPAAPPKTKTPPAVANGVVTSVRRSARPETYFAASAFAAWALPRLAAFLCTTPDFTALSIADT